MNDAWNPEDLARRLDELTPSGSQEHSVAPPDDALLSAASRLANSPRPTLSNAARARIESRVMAAVVPVPLKVQPRSTRLHPVMLGIMSAAAVITVALIGLGVVFTLQDARTGTLTPTPPSVALVTDAPAATDTDVPAATDTQAPATSTNTDVPAATDTQAPATSTNTDVPAAADTRAPATATNADIPAATDTQVPATATNTDVPTATDTQAPATATNTDIPTATDTQAPATATNTDIPAATAAPTELATASTALILTIEGEINAIEGNVIEVYGFRLALAENDPLLRVLRIRDTVRIQGRFAGMVTLNHSVALQIQTALHLETPVLTLLNDDPATNDYTVNPDTGEVWRDNGNCDNPPPPWATSGGWEKRCGSIPDGENPSDDIKDNNGKSGAPPGQEDKPPPPGQDNKPPAPPGQGKDNRNNGNRSGKGNGGG